MEIMRGYTLIQLWPEGEEIGWIKGVVAGCQLIHERAQNYMSWKLVVEFLGVFWWDEGGQIELVVTCGEDCGDSC